MPDQATELDNGCGTLILIVGPSGVGKDSLLDGAKEHFDGNSQIYFPQRTITRQSKTGEDHIAIDETGFSRLKNEGGFFLDWAAHGLSYGVSADIGAYLHQGSSVVINTSRKMIGPARERWRNVKVLHVTVHPDALRQRLQKRGRESAREIEQRIKRAGEIEVAADENTIVIDNSGPLRESNESFNKALVSILAGDSARSA